MKTENIKSLISFFSIIIGIIVALIVFDTYIYDRIDKKINDESYLSKISKTMRPYLIFDENEKYIYDHGALDHIENIEIVKHTDKDEILVEKIILTLKKYYQTAPLIECIGPLSYSFKSEKGSKTTWIYIPTSSGLMLWPEEEDDEQDPSIFKIEILR